MTSITKKYLINGPNNVVRLTDGVKVLYIFGDIHLESNEQTECIYNDKYDSMDIDKFLLSFIRNNKSIKYDIFHEMSEISYFKNNHNTNYYKKKYINYIDKLFQSNIKKKYTNFKFHYMDIRDNLFLFDIIQHYIPNYLDFNCIGKDYIYRLNELKKFIYLFKKSLNKNKYIIKLLNKYNNLKIKNKINKIYIFLIKNLKLYLLKINNLIKFIKLNTYNETANVNNLYNDINIKIDEDMNDINLLFMNICVVLTDLYFIRRFLDKKYIKNGILYTGLAHMADISYLLVKYFNYKITHINYFSENIDINDYIMNLSDNNLNYITIFTDLIRKKIDNKIYQCTDLFKFPNNFT